MPSKKRSAGTTHAPRQVFQYRYALVIGGKTDGRNLLPILPPYSGDVGGFHDPEVALEFAHGLIHNGGFIVSIRDNHTGQVSPIGKF